MERKDRRTLEGKTAHTQYTNEITSDDTMACTLYDRKHRATELNRTEMDSNYGSHLNAYLLRFIFIVIISVFSFLPAVIFMGMLADMQLLLLKTRRFFLFFSPVPM